MARVLMKRSCCYSFGLVVVGEMDLSGEEWSLPILEGCLIGGGSKSELVALECVADRDVCALVAGADVLDNI